MHSGRDACWELQLCTHEAYLEWYCGSDISPASAGQLPVHTPTEGGSKAQ
jgi:hypothetical protein